MAYRSMLNCAQQPSKQHSLSIVKNPFQNHLFMGTGFITKELVQIRGRHQATFKTLQKDVTQLHHGMARKKTGLFCSYPHAVTTLAACSRITLGFPWHQQESCPGTPLSS